MSSQLSLIPLPYFRWTQLDAGATVATDRQVLMDKEHCITADSHGVGTCLGLAFNQPNKQGRDTVGHMPGAG